MLRKIWDIVAAISVANVLGSLMLLVILLVTGGLNVSKLRLIRDVVAGRPLPTAEEPAPEVVADQADISTAGQLITREQTRTQILQLQIDQQMRELKDFQIQLDQGRAALDASIAEFQRQRSNWLAQRTAEARLLASEGFKKSLAVYESLSADQAKDLFMTMEDADAVRFLSAMEARKAAKIAKAFQSEAEKDRLRKILERMEKPQVSAETSQARAAAGAGETTPPVSAQPGLRTQ